MGMNPIPGRDCPVSVPECSRKVPKWSGILLSCMHHRT